MGQGALVARGEEATIGLMKLNNDKLHNFYSSPKIMRVIKSRIILAENVASMEKYEEINTKFLPEKLKKKENVWETKAYIGG